MFTKLPLIVAGFFSNIIYKKLSISIYIKIVHENVRGEIMICRGTQIEDPRTNEIKFINQDGEEILFGYRNQFAPLKAIITGCNGKYNYITEASHSESHSEFVITEKEQKIMTIVSKPGPRPKCKIIDFNRDIEVKFTLGLGFTKATILENGTELASMTRKRKEYVLEIKDSENPTLMASILMGAAEVNALVYNN